MTPGARVAAAIEILDQIVQGQPAEQALTRWARSRRFAGSKDRAAIRDHVFDTLRIWRSAAALGGGQTGRALMIGALTAQGADLDALFDGQGYASPPLSDQERARLSGDVPDTDQWNLPDWLISTFQDSLGPDAKKTALALQARAPITLRVNLHKADRDAALAQLSADGITATPNELCPSALTVVEGARKIRQSRCFSEGYVELQDASSQAVVAALPAGGNVLDYCAGGGGKALALAMDPTRSVTAHDIDPGRMADLPSRADRADVTIQQLETHALAQAGGYQLVLCDAPCSGSGAWRRAPEGKWRLTQERLVELTALQLEILTDAARLVADGGTLAYATCSVLTCENRDVIDAFLGKSPEWHCVWDQQSTVSDHGDGFYTAHLTRKL